MALKHKTLFAGLIGLITGAMWDEDHPVDAGGVTMEGGTATPAAEPGKLKLWARKLAGRILPASVDPNGMATWMQPFMGRNRVGMVLPIGNTSSQLPTVIGLPAAATVGTATSRTVETTSFFKSLRRFGYVSAATAGSIAAYRFGLTSMFWRGNAAGLGGFTLVMRVGASDAATVAGARLFVGISAGTINTIDPSTYSNMVCLGHDSADSTMHIMHNDGTGTATKINLGADFPANTLSEDVYELMLFCAPNSASMSYQVTRLNRPDIAPATGEITTDLPENTALMMPSIVRGNGPTALAVGFDLMGIYIETDN